MSNLLAWVFGQNQTIQHVGLAVDAGTLGQSLLITGPAQTGKFTLARALAFALNCQADNRPCGQCSSCQKGAHNNHPDISFLDYPAGDDSEVLKIEQIREIQHNLSLKPVESPYKIAVLGDFERATTSAANALLKTLEEPPAHVTLILTSRNTSLLLPTIVSRCQEISLKLTPAAELVSILEEHWQLPTEEALLLSRLAGGRLGWAIAAHHNPAMLSQRRQYLTELLDLSTQSYAPRLAYAQALAGRDISLPDVLNLWLSWWRDVLLIQTGVTEHIVNRDWAEKLTWFAGRLSLHQVLPAIKQLHLALSNLNSNVNSRLNLEVLLLNLPILAP